MTFKNHTEFFFSREPEKITLNDLAKDKMQTSLKPHLNGNSPTLDCSKPSDEIELKADNTKTAEEIKKPLKVDNEQPLPLNEKLTRECDQETTTKTAENITQERAPDVPVVSKPLAEIQIDLDDLTPLAEGQRILLDDEDIEVSLNFTADRPSPHVSVIVMSVMNKSRLPVEDFQFEASVKKVISINCCNAKILISIFYFLALQSPFVAAH